jgi:DNA-binding CsgD family transcriptional regulator/N-acetylneuraminic acid mutarotase
MINETNTNQLSEREREVLQLVAAGQSNQQIANTLGISINTVKVHLRNVFGKIGVASRTEATMYAVRSGIVAVDRVDRDLVEEADQSVADEPDEDAVVATVAVPPTPVSDLLIATPTDEEQLAEKPDPDDAQLRAIPADVVQKPDQPPIVVSTAPPQTQRRFPIAWIVGGVALVVVALIATAWVTGLLDRLGAGSRVVNEPGISGDEARWRQLQDAPDPRAAFAAVTVGDRVFAIAGENESGILDTVARFDTQSGTWTELSRKPTAVTDVRGAVLGGKIYVPGGRRSSDPQDVTDVVERYDPATEDWETVAALPEPRSAYALAVVEGNLYLFGGWDGTAYRSEVFEYDPDQDAWRERTPMPTARAYMDAGVVDGSVYVVGGENERGPLATNEVFTPAQEGAQAWSRRAPLPEARSRFSLAAASSILHVVGGHDPQIPPVKYNARTDNWQFFSAPPQPVGSQVGVVLLGETAVTIGGKTGDAAYSAEVQGYQAIFTIFSPAEY